MDWKFLLTSYEGRINRAKFWAGIGVFFVGAIIAAAIDNVLGTNFSSQIIDPATGQPTYTGTPFGWVYVIYSIAMLYCVLAVYTKRWHDRDKSGWWTLIIFVPFIGGIWFLVECGILAGTPGPNRFGPDPLA